MKESFDGKEAARFQKERSRRRNQVRQIRLEKARNDFSAISNMIVEKFHPGALMSGREDIQSLKDAIQSNAVVLDKIESYYREYTQSTLPQAPKRSYVDIEYDWDKLEYLQKKFETLVPLIHGDIRKFIDFLDRLIEAL